MVKTDILGSSGAQMGAEPAVTRPRVVRGGRADEAVDARVAAVLEVLGGVGVGEVARRYAVDAALVHRWVRAFVEAGTAQVTNTPTAEAAGQRDRFLTAFAHELRTPLAVARGWVAMLDEGDVPPSMLADTVSRLDGSLCRLSERILDVELLAGASLGRVRLDPSIVTVGELAHGLPGLTGVDGEGPDVEVQVDPDLFRRVLRDVWDAALLRPEPREVRLEATTLSMWVELRVVRDADPIEPAVLQALFEPFDTNEDDTGVTIGLYLARALTVAHGGTLGVDQDDRGAAFWVRIPRRPAAHARATVPVEEES
jgi:signal transduction histidine kinase